jgi:hypothetical protein
VIELCQHGVNELTFSRLIIAPIKGIGKPEKQEKTRFMVDVFLIC